MYSVVIYSVVNDSIFIRESGLTLQDAFMKRVKVKQNLTLEQKQEFICQVMTDNKAEKELEFQTSDF